MNTITRTHAARRRTAETVKRTVQDRLAARLEANEPARTARPRTGDSVLDETVMRLPDYRDDGFLVFIGEDATVLVEEHVKDIDFLTSGVRARSGRFPTEFGIVVMPHTETLVSVTYTGKSGEAQMAWRLVQDTLTA